MTEQLMTTKEVATYLGVAVSTLLLYRATEKVLHILKFCAALYDTANQMLITGWKIRKNKMETVRKMLDNDDNFPNLSIRKG